MRRARNKKFDFFLKEMLKAMDNILEYAGSMSYETFTLNSLVKDAVIRNFEILGEGVKHVPFSFQNKHKNMPWQQMLMLRNFIVHEFFDIDDEILWQIIHTDLGQNRNDMRLIISEINR